MQLGIILGTNRNLTSMTAALMFLHPNCQVLNHGFKVFKKHNFITNPDELNNFYDAARTTSLGMKVGPEGGSIMASHAFKRYDSVRTAYTFRYKDLKAKDEVKCLLWKEAKAFTNYLINNEVDITSIPANFIVPIRNPLDCTMSQCKRTGTSRGSNDHTGVLTRILDRLVYCLQQRDKCPERFCIFSELDLGKGTLKRLASLLALPKERRWLDDAMESLQLRPPYNYPNNLYQHFVNSIDRFKAWPRIYQHMKIFEEKAEVK